jgi:nucleotide-binding universal stress UspA family protein
MIEDTPAQYKTRMQKRAEKILGAVIHAAQAVGVACEGVHVEHEHPYQAIIDTTVSKGCDLIVMASHGRHGISAIVLGSETVKVLTHSKIPVLVYR